MKKKIIHFFVICLLLIVTTFLCSRYLGIKGLIIKEFRVENASLPDSFHGLKIIQLSDVHYGNTISEKELKHIVKKIGEVKPDIVVITGDLLDEKIKLNEKEQNTITNLLKEIDPTIGKFAIKGENDVSHKEWESIMTESSFINLNDTYDFVYHEEYSPILIAGLSSNINIKKNPKEKLTTTVEAIEKYETDTSSNLYSILLMHEPDYIDEIEYSKFDLILAGHSHDGQINLPIIKDAFTPRGAKKYNKEHYKKGNTEFYISSGIGTNSMTYRLFNKPSISLYRIVNK